jgi:Flp pilus assembly protein TadG
MASAPGQVTDDGMVTAETAVVLPVLVLVLALCMSAIAAGLAQVRCVDAARAAARELARDETASVAKGAALQVAPDAAVALTTSADLVEVTVRQVVTIGIPGVSGRPITVSATAVAHREPS